MHVAGVAMTDFGRMPGRSYADLAREAVRGALADAGVGTVDAVVFGSCAAQEWGQPSVRGQVVLRGLVEDGTLPAHVPVINVEAGCATGILAFQGALDRVAGGAGTVLAVGVDKTFLADPMRIGPLFEGVLDGMDPDGPRAFYAAAAEAAGLDFAPDPRRSVLMDIAALKARHHMARHGTTLAQLAAVTAKNRAHAADHPHAQARTPMSVEAVLADKPVVAPFTRAMCTPLAGAAAAVVVTARPTARSVPVRGSGFAGGMRGPLGAPSETVPAGQRAFAAAGVRPEEVDVAEVHDATAFAEIAALEDLGFRGAGQAAAWGAAGGTTHGGDVVVNPSGGLTSRGHPLAPSGLAMVHEVVTQLRGEAGARQVAGARLGLVHNAGGLVGFDEALCGVVLLE